MRGLIRFIGLLIAAVIIAALAIFAVENITLVPLRYVGQTFTGNLWWVCVGSAVLGFVLAFLLLAPGRVAAGWRGRTLGRERTRLQDELAVVRTRETQLRAEHEQLRAEHAQMATERDQLRQSGATPTPTTPTPTTPTPTTPTPTTPTPTTPATPAGIAPGDTSTNAAPLVPPAQPVGSGTAATASMAPEQRPATWSERLRGTFGLSRQGTYETPADDTGYPGPTAPTA